MHFLSRRLFSKTVTGTVKSFVPQRGFGFVTLEDGREVFVHNSEIKSSGFRMLVPNTKVKFELAHVDGKERATQVRNLDDSPIVPPPPPRSQGSSTSSTQRPSSRRQ